MICVVTWLHLLDSPMHRMHRKAKVQTVQKSNRLLISTVTRGKKAKHLHILNHARFVCGLSLRTQRLEKIKQKMNLKKPKNQLSRYSSQEKLFT